mgnify:FL=1|tara:strand:- start:5613 stop:6653 length:1041 start_codon:yes stop_codon:yes gene_type:complete
MANAWVLTFSEKVKGWVSFKSFVDMQLAISMANNYYTFESGDIYKHYNEDVGRNTFYGEFTNSSLDVVLNENPGLVKVFNTLNYEGSQSKVDRFVSDAIGEGTLDLDFQPITTYSDQEYYNLSKKDGWSVESIVTNIEEGNIKEFLEKEGKWFNNINRKTDITLQASDSGDFTFQGLGQIRNTTINGDEVVFGCTDINALNYNPLANADDGKCEYPGPVRGCTDPNALNYNPLAVLDDGSCEYRTGCTNPLAINYDPLAVVDDGSCVIIKPGCTDPSALNYDPSATVDNGTCRYDVLPSDPVPIIKPRPTEEVKEVKKVEEIQKVEEVKEKTKINPSVKTTKSSRY